MTKECILYKVQDDKLQCTACNHYCNIIQGNYGVCGIRKNINQKLQLMTYGKAFGVNIDPIEKKPLYHFLPGNSVFSWGTAGCNFNCAFCQNWDMSQFKRVEELDRLGRDLSPEDIIDISKQNNIKIIAATYNEPTVFFEYAFDVFKLAKKEGFKTVFVSNGYMSDELRTYLDGYLDAINIDLKAFSSRFYKEIVGAKLDKVLKNIEYVAKKETIWLEITTLLIPGYNDSSKELKEIAGFIAGLSKDIPWHISCFYGAYKMSYVDSTSTNKLIQAYEIGKNAGLNYVYIGSLNLEGYSDTFCPNCKQKIIERGGINQAINILNNNCQNCGTEIAGVWGF